MTLTIQPITRDEAFAFVLRHHRHHLPTTSWKFGCAVNDGSKVVGVVVCGRPVARPLDDGWTLEVTRLCTLDSGDTDAAKHAASKLYAAAWRAARALGYQRLITYLLKSEVGTSVKAAGWHILYSTEEGRSWNTPARPRVDKHPTESKTLWEAPGSVRADTPRLKESA